MDIDFSEKFATTIVLADYVALKIAGAAFSETTLPFIKLQSFGLKLE